MRAYVLAAVLLLAAPASAQERRGERERRWSVEVGATHVMLGDRHPTGGWTPTIAVRRWWTASEGARISAGVGAAAFDFSSTHWLGVLVGPEVGGDYRLSESWSAGGAFAVDGGRVSVCNDWHLCLRWWVLAPRAAAGVTYTAAQHVSTTAGLGARYVSTLAWSGVSWEPTIGVRFDW
ncbi:hypothetical protein WMF30_40055 [Sorangium sp. So ce134]